MKIAFAPNGKQITASCDLLWGCGSLLCGFQLEEYPDPDEPQFAGHTDVEWNSQRQMTLAMLERIDKTMFGTILSHGGKRNDPLWVCENNEIWAESQLIYKEVEDSWAALAD